MEPSGRNSKIRVHPSTIKLLTDTTWKYAHSILWQYFPFSEDEINLAKIYIKEYYESIPAKNFQVLAIQYFKSYRQYIRLAKKYITRLPEPYIAQPFVWLNRKSVKRFCNTKAKHHCLLMKRSKQCPLLHKCINCQFISSFPNFHFTT